MFIERLYTVTRWISRVNSNLIEKGEMELSGRIHSSRLADTVNKDKNKLVGAIVPAVTKIIIAKLCECLQVSHDSAVS